MQQPKTPLTQQRLKELLSYNPVTGQFHWLKSPRHGIEAGDVAGEKNRRHPSIHIDGTRYSIKFLRALYLEGGTTLTEAPAGFASVLEYETQQLAGFVARHQGAEVIWRKLVELGSLRISTLTDQQMSGMRTWLFEKLRESRTTEPSVSAAETVITLKPAELRTIIKAAVTEALSNLQLLKVAGAFPELATLLREDLRQDLTIYVPPAPTAEELASAAQARIDNALANHQSPLITAQLLAEVSGVEYGSRPKVSWAATLRRAGWVKLGSQLLTKHGPSSIYCRRDAAAEWVGKDVIAMRSGLPEGVYVGHQGGKS